MKLLKPTALATCLFLVVSASAQLRLPAAASFTSTFRSDMQKVVADYPGGFTKMRGAVVTTNPQSVEYASLFKIDMAESCTIIKYSAAGKSVYSWQAVMLTTESYHEAAKKYKWLFYQLKGMNVTYVVDQYTLAGKYVEASESMKFTTSTLTVSDAPEPMKKLKVEVAMTFEFPEWKVAVQVFDKEREDNERGEINDL